MHLNVDVAHLETVQKYWKVRLVKKWHKVSPGIDEVSGLQLLETTILHPLPETS